jgi:seryl-tRNA synthetase
MAVLMTGNASAVYDNGVGLRIRLDDSWFERTSEERRAITDKLAGLIRQFDELHQRIERAHQNRNDGAYAKTALPSLQKQLSSLIQEARQQLGELPIAFETIGDNPHPERTAAVAIRRDLPLMLLPHARKR